MVHFHQLAVKDVKRETPDCVSISFFIPEELKEIFSYTQGQYITLRTNINGEEISAALILFAAVRSIMSCALP
jgi:ring-1,2-phenylacetyl-CoA epoxidase subunit PaaE